MTSVIWTYQLDQYDQHDQQNHASQCNMSPEIKRNHMLFLKFLNNS